MVETIEWTPAGVVMIDQTRLPLHEEYVTCRTYEDVAVAIRNMVIRGAPAIGVAAAMGVALGVAHAEALPIAARPAAGRNPRAPGRRSAADPPGGYRHQPSHRAARGGSGARQQDGAHALQRRRAGDCGLWHRAGRDPRGRGSRQEGGCLRR